jgi:hypothetical protein
MAREAVVVAFGKPGTSGKPLSRGLQLNYKSAEKYVGSDEFELSSFGPPDLVGKFIAT